MGRYRLILLAPFALLAVEAVRIGFSRPRRRWGVIAVAVLAGAFLINPIPKGRFWRSSDFVAWALALEQPGGRVNAESLATLVEGYRLSGSESTAMNLLIRLIELREYDAAERLIADALPGGRVNPSLLRYYGAMLKLERGDPGRCGGAAAAGRTGPGLTTCRSNTIFCARKPPCGRGSGMRPGNSIAGRWRSRTSSASAR